MICDPFREEQYHRHRPANLPNIDADRVLVQTGANVPSEECEGAFHQAEETQQLSACTVSVETVPIKIWNQKGSLSIATFAEYTRTLCTQTRHSTCRVRPACRRDTAAEFRRARAAD